MSYTGTFTQTFTSGKFEGITLADQTITFPTKTRFLQWMMEINHKWCDGSLTYFVAYKHKGK